MDKAQYVARRKGKYMSEVLEAFEELIEPLLPTTTAAKTNVASFKQGVRESLGALATEAVEIMSLSDSTAINGVAIEQRDALSETRGVS